MAEAVCEKSRAVPVSASPRYIINADNTTGPAGLVANAAARHGRS